MKAVLFLCAAGALAGMPRIELNLAGMSTPAYYNNQVLRAGARPVESTDWGNTDGDGAEAAVDGYANPTSNTDFDGAAQTPGENSVLTFSNGDQMTGAAGPNFFENGPNGGTGVTDTAANPDAGFAVAGSARLRKLDQSIVRTHDGEADFTASAQPNGEAVTSRQDYTQRCNAGPSVSYSDCPFPIPKAYDSHDKDISARIQTRVFRVDKDGVACQRDRTATVAGGLTAGVCACDTTVAEACIVTNVVFSERSTYLFKYDVKDKAGNHAEQIVFALIVDDHSKPVITPCLPASTANANCVHREGGTLSSSTPAEQREPMGCAISTCGTATCSTDSAFETVEAGSSWKLCETLTVTDNVDSGLVNSVRYDVQRKTPDTWTTDVGKTPDYTGATWEYILQNGELKEAQHAIDTTPESSDVRYLVTMKVCDDAGVYGQNSMSNCVLKQKAIHITDSTRPVILLHGELGKDEQWMNSDADQTLSGGADVSGTQHYTAPVHECNMLHCNGTSAHYAACNAVYQALLPVGCSDALYATGGKDGRYEASHHDAAANGYEGVSTAGSAEWGDHRRGGASKGGGHRCRWDKFEQWCLNNATGIDSCIGYEDPGYTVKDSLDTWALHNGINSPKQLPTAWKVNSQGSNAINPRTSSTISGLPAPYDGGTAWDQAVSTSAGNIITYTAKDHYGNAAITKTRKVVVSDRTAPTITLRHNAHGAVLTAGESFHDSGASCWDMCDKTIATEASAKWVVCPGGNNAASNAVKGLMNSSFALANRDGTTDSVSSTVGNDWTEQALLGWLQESAGDNSPWSEAGSCQSTFGNQSNAPQVTGTYIRMYKCEDATGNVNWDTRKWVVVDQSAPIITRLGDAVETYDASKTVEYTDKGATCMDSVDGTLSSAVEVSGQVVNMKKTGTYVIRYDCQDSSGNEAEPVFRSVVIEDKSCPEVTLLGSQVNYVEAGYKWEDPGATCKDDLDDTCNAIVRGDTVNTGGAFYERKSCKDILVNYCHEQHITANAQQTFTLSGMVDDRAALADCQYPSSGLYFITRESKRIKVMCYFNQDAGATADLTDDVAITVKPCGDNDGCFGWEDCAQTWGTVSCDTTNAVTECAAWGMTPYTSTSSDANVRSTINDFISNFDTSVGEEYMTSPSSSGWATSDDQYLCSTNDESTYLHADDGVHPNLAHTAVAHDTTSAEAGKYVITYHAQDTSGNTECETKKRTVIVRDTLPPIISLHLGTKAPTQTASTAGVPFNANREGRSPTTGSNNLLYMGDKENDAPQNIMNQTSHFIRHDADADGSTADETANEDAFENNPIFDSSSDPNYAKAGVKAALVAGAADLMAEQQQTSSSTWFVLAAASGAAGLALMAFSRKRAVVTVEV